MFPGYRAQQFPASSSTTIPFAAGSASNENDARSFYGRQQQQQRFNSAPVSNGAGSTGVGGLTNVAAAFDALHPMYRAMRDLEAQKGAEILQLKEHLAGQDREIQLLRRRVKQLEQETRLGVSSLASAGNTEHLLSPTPSAQQHPHLSALNDSGYTASSRSPAGAARDPQHQNSLGAAIISDQERRELEEMLSRSIAGLAEAERALVSERSRFLVVDPAAISMERWRTAVSRLADLHDEVAHRRFGACLAAARLSGQLPSDVGQVAATQFLRGALSPVVLQHMSNCFKRAKAEEEQEAALGDPWRKAERQLAEEPDMLLHHISAVIERLLIDPGDEFVQ